MNIKDRNRLLKDWYEEELKIFEEWETKSAPSGEWEEYNYDYLMQQEKVYALEEVIFILEAEEKELNDRYFEEN